MPQQQLTDTTSMTSLLMSNLLKWLVVAFDLQKYLIWFSLQVVHTVSVFQSKMKKSLFDAMAAVYGLLDPALTAKEIVATVTQALESTYVVHLLYIQTWCYGMHHHPT